MTMKSIHTDEETYTQWHSKWSSHSSRTKRGDRTTGTSITDHHKEHGPSQRTCGAAHVPRKS